jgi:hypothetical protein
MRNVSSSVGTGQLPSGRNLDLDDLQWPLADHLPHPGFDPIQIPQDHLPGSDPVGRPTGILLKDGFTALMYLMLNLLSDDPYALRMARAGGVS